MPSINIREIDNTGADNLSYLDYTVLVPGIALTYEGATFNGLISSSSFFNSLADKAGEKPDGTFDLGFYIAKELVGQGLSVFYVSAYKYEDEEKVFAEPYTSVKDVYVDFADKGKYDLRFITAGGFYDWAEHATDAAAFALITAGNRGDATAVLDAPEKGIIKDESGAEEEPLDTAEKIDEWVQRVFGNNGLASIKIDPAYRKGVSWSSLDVAEESYGTYGTILAPQFNVKVGSETRTLPGSLDYLTAFAKQIRTTPEWFATAGAIRGASVYTNITPKLTFGDADIALLQPRSEKEGHVATNVICNVAPYGNVIWGNRTMHPLSKPKGSDTVQLQASSFLNIRQLCCTLKKTLYRAARRYTFDPNSDALWFNFCNAITPILNDMKANQGIRGYQLVQVPTKKKALLVARIIISPIEAIEDFDLTVEFSDSIEIAE